VIDDILGVVNEEVAEKLISETSLTNDNVAQAIKTVSDSIMGKAKHYIDNGKLLELKSIFDKGSDEEKEAFMNAAKEEIRTELTSQVGISKADADTVIETSIPVFIEVAKEKLLGPDGKFSFTDVPKILAFFKSGGKSIKPEGGLFGGLGSIFGN